MIASLAACISANIIIALDSIIRHTFPFTGSTIIAVAVSTANTIARDVWVRRGRRHRRRSVVSIEHRGITVVTYRGERGRRRGRDALVHRGHAGYAYYRPMRGEVSRSHHWGPKT